MRGGRPALRRAAAVVSRVLVLSSPLQDRPTRKGSFRESVRSAAVRGLPVARCHDGGRLLRQFTVRRGVVQSVQRANGSSSGARRTIAPLLASYSA